jgi:LacI family transcriptional regulator
MLRKKAVTLTDIALEVGVSAMTVSAVLNGGNSTVRVSEQTRARIQEVARSLQYRPNAVARGLSSRRMNTIGVIAEFNSPGDMNLVVHEMLDGILEGAVIANHKTSIYHVANWGLDEQRILDYCDGMADGFILLGPNMTQRFAARLFHTTPFVTIHNCGSTAGAPNIDIDNEKGGYLMTKHLIDLGHRRIAHFSGNPGRSGTQERIDGYKRALHEAGIEFDPNLAATAYYVSSGGYNEMNRMLDNSHQDKQPSAVFCANDAIACGALDALNERNINVPSQISIAGFDDAIIAQMAARRLTTVRQPFRSMGIKAVELLLDSIDGNVGTTSSVAELMSTLIQPEQASEIASGRVIDGSFIF